MIKKEPVMSLRKNLGEILNEVEYKRDTIIVTRAGRPSAAIIDIKLFEKIKNMKDKFQILSSELQQSFIDMKEEEIDLVIDEAITNSKKIKK